MQGNVNVGFGEAVGLTANVQRSSSGHSFSVTGTPLPKVGAGYGAQISVGAEHTATVATKPLIARKCARSHN